jgi:hypothetical protein
MTFTESNPVKGVEGGFELDLASLAEASSKKMMSQDVCFCGSLKKGARAGLVLYQLPLIIENFYLPDRIFFSLR